MTACPLCIRPTTDYSTTILSLVFGRKKYDSSWEFALRRIFYRIVSVRIRAVKIKSIKSIYMLHLSWQCNELFFFFSFLYTGSRAFSMCTCFPSGVKYLRMKENSWSYTETSLRNRKYHHFQPIVFFYGSWIDVPSAYDLSRIVNLASHIQGNL